jgi:hypothetical protein
MNSTLGLKARPNESFSAAFQPGQANAACGLNKMMAKKEIKTAILTLRI